MTRRGLAAKQRDRWRRRQRRDEDARWRHQFRHYRPRWVLGSFAEEWEPAGRA